MYNSGHMQHASTDRIQFCTNKSKCNTNGLLILLRLKSACVCREGINAIDMVSKQSACQIQILLMAYMLKISKYF